MTVYDEPWFELQDLWECIGHPEMDIDNARI